jgi:hypothetical protein
LTCDLLGHYDTERLLKLVELAPSGSGIAKETLDILEMLLEKNISYGNSALAPVRIFSSASTEEQLLVRIDDKLNRLQNGREYDLGMAKEDTISDLIGYLILLNVQRRVNKGEAT